MPLDLSVVESSGVLNNSALKSRIQLSKKRKHQPPGKRKKGKTQMDFLRQHSASTESFQSPPSSHTSVFASSKFYILPCSESSDSQTHEDSQISVLGNEKGLVRNAAVLQRISEVPQAYSNDNDIAEVSVLYRNKQLSNKSGDMPLDFSVVKSSGVLDNSTLKNRIQLSKKRKHRPPGKRKNESFQSRPSSPPSIFTSSAFHNLLRSYDSKDSQTSVPEKQKTKDRLLKPKLWKMKT
ncbi:hypothetical protein PDJAM_G00182910 [Pangasius djambal]|uniref:Uncharacterized protein n=1 Tax=Pangasius djambal TaxID=1691987 RepID=A0ACC5Y3V9_9TELE|nr:hypothetical protein [Pangasius djambal]